jgi:hypothetical protein
MKGVDDIGSKRKTYGTDKNLLKLSLHLFMARISLACFALSSFKSSTV